MKKILLSLLLLSTATFGQLPNVKRIGLVGQNYKFDQGLQVNDTFLPLGPVNIAAITAVGDATDSVLSRDPVTGFLELRPPGASTFSQLTDAYDLTTAPIGSVPMKSASGNFLYAVLFNEEPITVDAATTAALSGTWDYDNGTAGVGATLTRQANGSLANQDGVPMTAGKRLLVKNQTGSQRLRNGPYEVTVAGSAGTQTVLTRTTDADETTELNGQVVIPSGGNTNARRIFSQASNVTTIGTSNITYSTSSSGGGNIYSDGRQDFTAAQRWDFGTLSFTEITDTYVKSDDGSGNVAMLNGAQVLLSAPPNAMTIDGYQGMYQTTDGSGTASMSPLALSIGDAAAISTVTSSAVTVDDLTQVMNLTASALYTNNTIRIRTTDNSANIVIDPNGGGSVVISTDLEFTLKEINTTASDTATINSPAGRFRKDNTGASFTVTCSYSTLDSVIDITLASDPGDPDAYHYYVVASDGSFEVVFAVAPANNTDVNFVIIN